MKIISHRGYWFDPLEKNLPIAFKRSFSAGFGTETDIRDCMGRLVVSHEMPLGDEQTLEDFLSKAGEFGDISKPLTIALNIKADGLSHVLSKLLLGYPQLDCFVFDMATPDMRHYLQAGIPVFTRMSEVEGNPVFLDQAAGIWLDSFSDEWYDITVIKRLIKSGKRVCVVSPELHGRPYINNWQILRYVSGSDNLILCTDKPEEANYFFNMDAK